MQNRDRFGAVHVATPMRADTVCTPKCSLQQHLREPDARHRGGRITNLECQLFQLGQTRKQSSGITNRADSPPQTGAKPLMDVWRKHVRDRRADLETPTYSRGKSLGCRQPLPQITTKGQPFEQRIARQTIGPMYACTGDLTNRIQSRHAGRSRGIHRDTTHVIVRRR